MRGKTAKLLRKFTGFHPGAARSFVDTATAKAVRVPIEVHSSGGKVIQKITSKLAGSQPRGKYQKAKKLYRDNPRNFHENIFPVIA